MRRLVGPVIATVLAASAVLVPAGAASAQREGACAQYLPDVAFDTRAAAGPVTITGSGVNEAVTERFAEELEGVVTALDAEIGGIDGVEVCLFPDRLPVDSEALGWPEGQTLRALASGEDGVVVLSALFFGQVRAAATVGLVHVAQWRAAGPSYPDLFAREVIGFYQSRDAGNVETVHRAFVRSNIGLREPWGPIPWNAGEIVDPLLWNPEFGYGSAGDFAWFAITNAGPDGDEPSIFARPDDARLQQLDQQWRESLFAESGSSGGGSRGWIAGLIALVVVLGAGIALAVLNRLSKTRAEQALRDAALRDTALRAAAESEDSGERGPVTTSVATGARRRHPGVRRPQPPPVGRRGDDGDGSPAGRPVGGRGDGVPPAAQPDDDIFRHPSFREED